MTDKNRYAGTVTTTLRIPEKRNGYLKQKSTEIGISQNALILMLLDIGIKCYERIGYSDSEVGDSDIPDLMR